MSLVGLKYIDIYLPKKKSRLNITKSGKIRSHFEKKKKLTTDNLSEGYVINYFFQVKPPHFAIIFVSTQSIDLSLCQPKQKISFEFVSYANKTVRLN